MLLEDFNYMESYELTEDKSRGNKYFLRGVFSRVDTPNKNKRVYPRSVMEESVGQAQPLIEQRALVGELDHPPTPKVNVEKISHVVTRLALADDGAVIGEMEVISPKLKELIEAKIRLGTSTRGLGQVRPYSGTLGEGLVEVQPGYKMRAIDIVFDPSAETFPKAFVEDVDEKILLGSTIKFRKIWEDIFN
tara:strand:- start:505 stop:1077 length:573 start_codon:yes stop_codon:yes gene_type:complete